MIVITGASGFIGSVLLSYLNQLGQDQIILVDDPTPEKLANTRAKKFIGFEDRKSFPFTTFVEMADQITGVFHLGARTDTTEKDWSIFQELNLDYSKQIWKVCAEYQIPLVYASSAATYGLGEQGYVDDHQDVSALRPLNPYGQSKQDFDVWALGQSQSPPFWCGLKFFNVYGPNEYHKGRMASVVWHAFRQISSTGQMKLFRSHRSDIADGQQSRDFIFVEDVVAVCQWMMDQQPESGLYNLGTGTARSFYDLVSQTFKSMGLEPKISFIDTPVDIRETYQYFTEANMDKLRKAGYAETFQNLESGIDRYVRDFLMKGENPAIY